MTTIKDTPITDAIDTTDVNTSPDGFRTFRQRVTSDGNINLNIACPGILTLPDGHRIKVRTWTPRVAVEALVTVTVEGILCDEAGEPML